MPLKGDGNRFTGNGIGVHNQALSEVELNHTVFEGNGIGYLEGEGRYAFMENLFAEGTPIAQRDELLNEIEQAVKKGEPSKAESIFEKYDFHKWIASGVNITKIVGALVDAGQHLFK